MVSHLVRQDLSVQSVSATAINHAFTTAQNMPNRVKSDAVKFVNNGTQLFASIINGRPLAK